MIFDLLPAKDKDTIQYYINHYVGQYATRDAEDLATILSEWDYAKRNLFNIFGKQFILKRPVDILLSEDEKIARMDGEIQKIAFHNFIKAFNTKVATYYKELDEEIRDNLRSLVRSKNLCSNTYTGESFSFINPETKKKVQIQHGCSVVKVLGKLARDWGLEEEYETFRNAHSHVIEINRLKGNLCISIHPMDYITMSDNDCGWKSCMSWTTENGSSKQGTVEMMNSPDVVIAYLETSEPYYLGIEGNTEYSWNNKAWRKLFIVDNDFITGIKGYPFQSDILSNMVLNWLRDLVGAEYYSETPYKVSPDDYTILDEKFRFSIEFECGHMYNDFYNNNPVVDMFINKTLFENATPKSKGLTFFDGWYDEKYDFIIDPIYFEYSGACQCMWCGGNLQSECDENDDWELFDGTLICSDCSSSIHCDICHLPIAPGAIVTEMGEDCCLCASCADELTNIDDIDKMICWSSELEGIHLYSLNSNYKDELYSIIFTRFYDWKTWKDYLIEDYEYGLDCNDDGEYYVYFEELNEAGKKLFGVKEL